MNELTKEERIEIGMKQMAEMILLLKDNQINMTIILEAHEARIRLLESKRAEIENEK